MQLQNNGSEIHSVSEVLRQESERLRQLAEECQKEVLRQESERLRQLAEECQKREEDEAEMRSNYPHFKRFVYDTLKERALREVPELPENVDLLAYGMEHGAVSSETMMAEVERILKGK